MGALLAEGAKAPSFTLFDGNGGEVSLADFAERWLVLYFYPRANTSGCTKEAQGFSGYLALFAHRDCAVVGVSPDSAKALCGFIEKKQLSVPLLSDPDHAVADAFGVWREKTVRGEKKKAIVRSTFLIDPEGTVARVFSPVKVEGHHREVLAALDDLL